MPLLGALARAASARRLAGCAEGASALPALEGNPRKKALHLSVVQPAHPRLLRRRRDARLCRARHVAGPRPDRGGSKPGLFRRGDRLRAAAALAQKTADPLADLA